MISSNRIPASVVCVIGADLKSSDVDGMLYSTILYGSGPGHTARSSVENPDDFESQLKSEDMNRVHAAAVPRQWATHGAEDVPVYALGKYNI